MDRGPLVSIILPVCDAERYIGATLDSALRQTYRNTEVIVVDDGSRDGTRGEVEARAIRDPRIRVIGQSNGGVASARNRALAVASGELVAPLDADDLWDPTKIERQVRRMIEAGDDTGLVYCWWVWIDVDGAVLDCSPRWRIEGNAHDTLLQVNYTGNASVPLYRRRYLDEVGGYDVLPRQCGAQGCEDWDVALKVAERSRVAVVPSLLAAYRRRPDSMSARSDQMWRSHRLLLKSARQRRPDLCPVLVRHSRSQFALHLAGVSFRCGVYGQAVGWGLRALRSRIALQVLPYVIRLLSKTLLQRSRRSGNIIRPGVRFGNQGMPRPLIPYDRIYRNRRLLGIGDE